ncbi:hypothetical protein, partial [Escherichia coli]|uniref:hypothetical protein n=1 Tax=Escherichia coli TaxID=562 RepID=UPI000A53F965
SGEKRVFLVILFTSFSGSLVSRIPGAVQAVYGGRPARHPPGRCFATFKSAPGGFVLVGRVFTDKQQIKQKAQSSD